MIYNVSMVTYRFIIVLLLIALVPACGGWSQGDTYSQLAGLGVAAVDWRQTRTIADHPGQWHEINPLLGDHPDSQSVDAYFFLSQLSKFLIAAALPAGDWRTAWQYGCIGLSAGLVAHNYRQGIRP